MEDEKLGICLGTFTGSYVIPTKNERKMLMMVCSWVELVYGAVDGGWVGGWQYHRGCCWCCLQEGIWN